jgi:hemerythrin-like domain-containing protein
MKSTTDLKEEHESIAFFLAILEAIISRMQSRKQISLEDLQWLFEFNRDFILKCHNGKEDCILFLPWRMASSRNP